MADLLFQLSPFMIAVIPWFYTYGIGLHATGATVWFKFWLTVAISMWLQSSVLYFVGGASGRLEQALALTPGLYLIMFVLTGFFLPASQMAKWFGWVRHFTVFRYPFYAFLCTLADFEKNYGPHFLITNEMGDILFNDKVVPSTFYTLVSSAEETNYWFWIGTGLLVGVFYRILAFICLLFLHRREGIDT